VSPIAVFQWAALNRDALVDYWTGRIATGEFLRRLQRARQAQTGETA
jgi:hypothetical protein